jgi:DNA-binding transcriptional LysR family regulator
MELKQLQYFYDVLRLHSFTAAARNNHVSQSAVSQKIKALETEMGVPLLHRNGREFTATAAGTKLYDYANAILSASEQAVKDVRKAAAGQELPRFTIGMIAATTFWEPVAAAQIFLQRHPQSNIAVLYGTNQQLQQSLLNHSIDIAFADNSAHFADYYQTHTVRRTYIGVETARSVLAALPSATLMPPLEEVTSTALSDVPCILQPLVTPLSGISQNEGASEQTAMEPAGVESLSMTYPSRFPQTAHHASDDASMRTRQLADGTNALVSNMRSVIPSSPDMDERLRPEPTRTMIQSVLNQCMHELFGLTSPVVYASTSRQVHALTTIGRGYTLFESSEPINPQGAIIRRVPLVDKNGPVVREFHLVTLKSDSQPATSEYSRILEQLLTDTKV